MRDNVEVKQLDLGYKSSVRKEWLKIWTILGERILKLPEWMQPIVLKDVNNAVENRIATMEMINNATRTS